MRLTLLLIALVVTPSVARGESDQLCDGKGSYESCLITASDVTSLCNFVAGKTPDAPGARFMFAAEGHLWKMAGAHPQLDSDSAAVAKVRRMWRANRAALTCNTATLSGDIFAIAVRSTFPEFIEMLYYFYDLDLNHIDPVQKITVMDFIQKEIGLLASNGQGNSEAANALRGYLRTFREDLGLKHAAELLMAR